MSNWFVIFNMGRKEEKRKQRSQSGEQEHSLTMKTRALMLYTGHVFKSSVSRCFGRGTVTIKTRGPASVGLEGAFRNDPLSQTLTSLTLRIADSTWKAA